MLKVNEIFESVSGEVGRFRQGEIVTFIRLTGCNLRCRWCDTAHAQEGQGYSLSVPDIIKRVKAIGGRRIIITGGEPLLQKETVDLLYALSQNGFHVQVETNGSFPLPSKIKRVSYVVDYKTPSSGMAGFMLSDDFFCGLEVEHWVKFVIDDMIDFNFAKCKVKDWEKKSSLLLDIAFSPTPNFPPQDLYFQMIKEGLKDVVLSIQIHKHFDLK